MTTLRLPQFSIETSGMRKSKSLEPLSFLKESVSSRGSSPLPGTLETFANSFDDSGIHFDLLEHRSKSTDPVSDAFSSDKKQQKPFVWEEQSVLIQSGLICDSSAIYSSGAWKGSDTDDVDIKFHELESVRRSFSLDAVTDEDLLTKGLIVPTGSKAHRSCILIEKTDENWSNMIDAVRRMGM